MMRFRNLHHFRDEQADFANLIHEDLTFPKQATDFQTISDYLELNPLYSHYIDLFDKLWLDYEKH